MLLQAEARLLPTVETGFTELCGDQAEKTHTGKIHRVELAELYRLTSKLQVAVRKPLADVTLVS